MLPNHSPLRVAEEFRVLEALHPGRIDLGIGRARDRPCAETHRSHCMLFGLHLRHGAVLLTVLLAGKVAPPRYAWISAFGNWVTSVIFAATNCRMRGLLRLPDRSVDIVADGNRCACRTALHFIHGEELACDADGAKPSK